MCATNNKPVPQEACTTWSATVEPPVNKHLRCGKMAQGHIRIGRQDRSVHVVDHMQLDTPASKQRHFVGGRKRSGVAAEGDKGKRGRCGGGGVPLGHRTGNDIHGCAVVVRSGTVVPTEDVDPGTAAIAAVDATRPFLGRALVGGVGQFLSCPWYVVGKQQEVRIGIQEETTE